MKHTICLLAFACDRRAEKEHMVYALVGLVFERKKRVPVIDRLFLVSEREIPPREIFMDKMSKEHQVAIYAELVKLFGRNAQRIDL